MSTNNKEAAEPMDEWVDYAKRSGLLDENGVAPDPSKAQTAWFAFTYAWNRRSALTASAAPATEQAPAGEVPSDELRTEEAAIVGFLHQNDGHEPYLNLNRDSSADHSEALMTVAQHKRIIAALSTPPAVPPMSAILKAIDDEPELPDDMPPEMAKAVTQAIRTEDSDFFIAAMRLAVRMTKDGIRERVLSAAPAAPQGEQPK